MNTLEKYNLTNGSLTEHRKRLAELDSMTVGQLQRCFYEISGEVKNTRNKKSLKRRLRRMLEEIIEQECALYSGDDEHELQEENAQVEEEKKRDIEEESTEIEEDDREVIAPLDLEEEQKSTQGVEDGTGFVDEAESELMVEDEQEWTNEATFDAEGEEKAVEDVEAASEDKEAEDSAQESEVDVTADETEICTENIEIEEEQDAPLDVVETKQTKPRDSRLPDPGTVIIKTHKGVEHKVTVLERGFSYEGNQYRSLSALAKKISGTTWNGYSFFGLAKRSSRKTEEDAA